MLPVTSNFCVGAVLPNPRLPLLSIADNEVPEELRHSVRLADWVAEFAWMPNGTLALSGREPGFLYPREY